MDLELKGLKIPAETHKRLKLLSILKNRHLFEIATDALDREAKRLFAELDKSNGSTAKLWM